MQTITKQLLASALTDNDDEVLPSLRDVVRASRKQPTAEGTIHYLTERPEFAEFGDLVVGTDQMLRDHIAVAAYYIWQNEGCHHGWDKHHWERAEADLRGFSYPVMLAKTGTEN